MSHVGHKVWAIPGGHVPLRTTGHEPEFTSNDTLCILNAGDKDAEVKMTFFYADSDPIGPYELTVSARRVKHFRINDLINPEAVRLDVDYACLIESSERIVVQFSRRDTQQAANAIAMTMAFPVE